MPFLRESREGLVLQLQVQPGARKNEIIGLHGDRLKIKINAPPVDGAANTEIIRFIAKTLGLRRQDIEISSGESSRLKNLRLIGAHSAVEIRATLQSNFKT